ncbi:MAG: molybdopterin-dependent oxidoreductase [Thaumarchaeota archaeon]|nr:molybdopterin-dependent oxidoreductase [Nitrososphaerota archaeon]
MIRERTIGSLARGGYADTPRLLGQLPTFSTKGTPFFDPANWRLIVSGLVNKPLKLSYDEIINLPPVRLIADFNCIEGWSVKDIEWEGVRVKTILELAEPMPSAGYALFKAGKFTSTLSLSQADQDKTILAHRYKGEPLAFEHGAPLRLIFPSQECFESVKWVKDIELIETYIEGTSKNIALARVKDKTS